MPLLRRVFPPKRAFLLVFCALGFIFPVAAQEEGEEPPILRPPTQGGLMRIVGAENTVLLAPPTALYPRYLADPRYPRIVVMRAWATESEIPAASDDRFDTALGATAGFVRVHPNGQPDIGFQVDAGAAIFNQWDIARSLDGIGWDGVYHISLTWRTSPWWSFRAGTRHMSSHLSDEYIATTGRERIEYTREEFVAGVAYSPEDEWIIYLENAFAWTIRDYMEPFRVQAGVEFRPKPRWWGGRLGWYAATDWQFWEEDDWDASITAQLGLIMPLKPVGRQWRLGAQYYRGRSTMGEFFFRDEEMIGIGLWLDI